MNRLVFWVIETLATLITRPAVALNIVMEVGAQSE
jgi:hypothetical protein